MVSSPKPPFFLKKMDCYALGRAYLCSLFPVPCSLFLSLLSLNMASLHISPIFGYANLRHDAHCMVKYDERSSMFRRKFWPKGSFVNFMELATLTDHLMTFGYRRYMAILMGRIENAEAMDPIYAAKLKASQDNMTQTEIIVVWKKAVFRLLYERYFSDHRVSAFRTRPFPQVSFTGSRVQLNSLLSPHHLSLITSYVFPALLSDASFRCLSVIDAVNMRAMVRSLVTYFADLNIPNLHAVLSDERNCRNLKALCDLQVTPDAKGYILAHCNDVLPRADAVFATVTELVDSFASIAAEPEPLVASVASVASVADSATSVVSGSDVRPSDSLTSRKANKDEDFADKVAQSTFDTQQKLLADINQQLAIHTTGSRLASRSS